jgi:hypothetical protein
MNKLSTRAKGAIVNAMLEEGLEWPKTDEVALAWYKDNYPIKLPGAGDKITKELEAAIGVNNDIPRYVLSLTDTYTIVDDSTKGYYSITVGVDNLADFFKPLKKRDRTNEGKTDLERMFLFFQEEVDKLNATGEKQ